MKTYTIFIEVFGRKVQLRVQAVDKIRAAEIAKKRFNIIDIKETDSGLDFLRGMFGI